MSVMDNDYELYEPPRRTFFTCRKCGKAEYRRDEFQTIKLGDIFTHLTQFPDYFSESNPLCTNCSGDEESLKQPEPITKPKEEQDGERSGTESNNDSWKSIPPDERSEAEQLTKVPENQVPVEISQDQKPPLPTFALETPLPESRDDNGISSRFSAHDVNVQQTNLAGISINHSFQGISNVNHDTHNTLTHFVVPGSGSFQFNNHGEPLPTSTPGVDNHVSNQPATIIVVADGNPSQELSSAHPSSLSGLPMDFVSSLIKFPNMDITNSAHQFPNSSTPTSTSQDTYLMSRNGMDNNEDSNRDKSTQGQPTLSPESNGNNNDDKNNCPVCNKTFKSAKVASLHFKRVHEKSNHFICGVCSSVFSSKASLEAHAASHETGTYTSSLDSLKSFDGGPISGLNGHRANNFADTCDRNHISSNNVTSGSTPVFNVVTNFDANGKSSFDLSGGESIVGKDKVVINICPSNNNNNNNNTNNNNNNEEQVVFHCDKCPQNFKLKSSFKQHIKAHETQSGKKFKCQYCASGFSKGVNLRYHIKKKHPEVSVTSTQNSNSFDSSNNNYKSSGNNGNYGEIKSTLGGIPNDDALEAPSSKLTSNFMKIVNNIKNNQNGSNNKHHKNNNSDNKGFGLTNGLTSVSDKDLNKGKLNLFDGGRNNLGKASLHHEASKGAENKAKGVKETASKKKKSKNNNSGVNCGIKGDKKFGGGFNDTSNNNNNNLSKGNMADKFMKDQSGGSKGPGEAESTGEGQFKCEQCGRAFMFKNNLKAHLRTHSRDKKYTCEICEKSFIYKESLKNHMLLHSNELPYDCDICGKKFRDRSNRRKHVKNVHKYMFINGQLRPASEAIAAGLIPPPTASTSSPSVNASSGANSKKKKARKKPSTSDCGKESQDINEKKKQPNLKEEPSPPMPTYSASGPFVGSSSSSLQSNTVSQQLPFIPEQASQQHGNLSVNIQVPIANQLGQYGGGMVSIKMKEEQEQLHGYPNTQSQQQLQETQNVMVYADSSHSNPPHPGSVSTTYTTVASSPLTQQDQHHHLLPAPTQYFPPSQESPPNQNTFNYVQYIKSEDGTGFQEKMQGHESAMAVTQECHQSVSSSPMTSLESSSNDPNSSSVSNVPQYSHQPLYVTSNAGFLQHSDSAMTSLQGQPQSQIQSQSQQHDQNFWSPNPVVPNQMHLDSLQTIIPVSQQDMNSGNDAQIDSNSSVVQQPTVVTSTNDVNGQQGNFYYKDLSNFDLSQFYL